MLLLDTNRNAGGTLIDESTGATRTISGPSEDCTNSVFGGGYLLFACNASPPQASYMLDTLSSGATTPFAETAGVPAAIGSRWLQVSSTGEEAHSITTTEYFNLATGAVETNPAPIGSQRVVDLDNPTLTTPACRPLRVPSAWQISAGGPVPGQLIQLDSVGLEIGTYRPDQRHQGAPFVRLQRCGSKATRTLHADQTSLAFDSRLLLWQVSNRKLEGLGLPSEKSFRVQLPASVGVPGGLHLAFGIKYLYVNTGYGDYKAWRTPLAPLLRQADAR